MKKIFFTPQYCHAVVSQLAFFGIFWIIFFLFLEKPMAQSPLKKDTAIANLPFFEKCVYCVARTTPITLAFEAEKKPLTIVFQDDFDSLNLQNWQTKFAYPPPYDRYITNADCILLDERVEIKNGILHLNAKKGLTKYLNTERNWSIGSVISRNDSTRRDHEGGCFRHGFFEIRAKMPKGAGFWPAFWLFGWAGEIDIFEISCCNTKRIATSLHNGDYGKNHKEYSHYEEVKDDLAADFHTYGAMWTPYYITFYFDGNPYYTFYRFYKKRTYKNENGAEVVGYVGLTCAQLPKNPTEKQQIYESQLYPNEGNYADLILGTGMGSWEKGLRGQWLKFYGACGIGTGPNRRTPDSSSFLVDYVRVWQQRDIRLEVENGRAILRGADLPPANTIEWTFSDDLEMIMLKDNNQTLFVDFKKELLPNPPKRSWIQVTLPNPESCQPFILRKYLPR